MCKEKLGCFSGDFQVYFSQLVGWIKSSPTLVKLFIDRKLDSIIDQIILHDVKSDILHSRTLNMDNCLDYLVIAGHRDWFGLKNMALRKKWAWEFAFAFSYSRLALDDYQRIFTKLIELPARKQIWMLEALFETGLNETTDSFPQMTTIFNTFCEYNRQDPHRHAEFVLSLNSAEVIPSSLKAAFRNCLEPNNLNQGNLPMLSQIIADRTKHGGQFDYHQALSK